MIYLRGWGKTIIFISLQFNMRITSWFVAAVLFCMVIHFPTSFALKLTKKQEKNKSTVSAIKSDADAFAYLSKYGYNRCEQTSGSNQNPENKVLCQSSVKSMVKDFQTAYQLPVTGVLDRKTLVLMNTPRCGMRDTYSVAKITNLWPKKSLTWRLSRRSIPPLGFDKVRAIINESLNDWAKYAALTFQEVTPNVPADLDLAFIDQQEDNVKLFDGPDGTLAYAFFPTVGIIRFETAELWTNSYDQSGKNLRTVATHEIGHALGLEHSLDKSSLMFAFYRPFQPKEILPRIDQDSIQTLYGPRLIPTTERTITKTSVTHGKKARKWWVPSEHGKIPPDALVGGQENGRRVYVARFKTRGNSMVPGKILERSTAAECAHFGIQRSNTYEVLTSSNPSQEFKWIKTRSTVVPEGALLVSQDGGYQRYVGRIHHSSGTILLGKYIMPNGVFYYPYQGKELSATENFEVLSKV